MFNQLLTFERREDVFHRLWDVPLVIEDGYYEVGEVSKAKLLGTVVEDLILARLMEHLARNLMGCLWQRDFKLNVDPKWFELVYLSLLSTKLNYFNYYTIKSSKFNNSKYSFDYIKVVWSSNNKGVQTRRLLKDDFIEFLGRVDDIDVIGYPSDNNFPVIDGARPFKYRDGVDNNVTYVTALFQATLAKQHPSHEGMLNKLISIIKNGVKNRNIKKHRIEFWWLVREKTSNSLWSCVTDANLCERVVWPKPLAEILPREEEENKEN